MHTPEKPTRCIDCGGSDYCKKHKRTKSYCPDPECGGGQALYQYKILRSQCKDPECGGGGTYCECGKIRSRCKKCGGIDNHYYCKHGKQRCVECTPLKHLRHVVGGAVRDALKAKKNRTSNTYLGCDYAFYRVWLEMQFKPGMTWENYGTVWEIDHRVPLFYRNNGEVTEEIIIERLHYRNAWPMLLEENRSKGNRRKD